MGKIGRNDPCHCGSGKKYKRCCLEKDEQKQLLASKLPKQPIIQWMTYEEVDEMSTDEIEEKLIEIGVPFDREEFLQATTKFYSAEELSENWFQNYSLNVHGREEDFPLLSAWVVWDRLGSEQN